MKSVCLYSSYVNGTNIPYYVEYYLLQLKAHFDLIIYITNKRELDEEASLFLSTNGIEFLKVENEGYDFGMWHKGLNLICPDFVAGNRNCSFDRVALVNDSCILFKSLDEDFSRINQSGAGYSGMIISDRYATHLQSFFLVIDGEAVNLLFDYFAEHGIVKDYRQVIQTYEIGLTQRMIAEGVKVFSLYNNQYRDFPKNPSFALVKELIDKGMPLIKKKIVFRNYRGLEYYWVVRMNFDTDYRKYFKQIRNIYATGLIDLDRVMEDAPRKSTWDIFFFAIARSIANAARMVPGFRWLFHKLIEIFKKYFRRR